MSWQCEPCNQGSHGNCPDTNCECESCWESNQEAKRLAAQSKADSEAQARIRKDELIGELAAKLRAHRHEFHSYRACLRVATEAADMFTAEFLSAPRLVEVVHVPRSQWPQHIREFFDQQQKINS